MPVKKKVWKLIECTTCVCVCVCVFIYILYIYNPAKMSHQREIFIRAIHLQSSNKRIKHFAVNLHFVKYLFALNNIFFNQPNS